MTATAIDRHDLRDVFLATQDMSVVTIGTVSEEFDGRVNKSYARLILATLTEMGLLYEAAEGATSSHEGYHWDQGPEQAFDDAWDARHNDPDARVAGETKKEHTVTNTTPPAVGGTKCQCGCGGDVMKSRLYRPGHDARHASRVAKAAAATHDDKQHHQILDTLPTPTLRAKAAAQVGRIWAKERAKADTAKAKAERANRPATAKAEWEAGEAKVGRWIYPARRKGNKAQVNTQRDGKGSWKDLDRTKFQAAGTN